jgi:hypothetical protein
MSWTQADLSFKTLIDRRVTSSSKQYYNEEADDLINKSLQDVWTSSIPSSAALAVSNGVAEQRVLFTMTEDTSVGSQQCYYAYSGSRLKDWVPPKYGSDYIIRVYQNTNVEIFSTDPCGWFFNYQTGVLIFSGSTSSLSKPFKISGYRYVGTKGAVVKDPAVSVADHLAAFTDSTGLLLKDSNIAIVEQYVLSIPTPTGTGVKGQRYYDSTTGYLYDCVATNTWVRSVHERTW